MVDEAINTEVDNPQPKKELSPGEMLLQARLNAGLTQEQVAKDLYMTVYKVKALETDDYKRLNSDTFARGYIRAYANLVKLDVVAVLAAYDKLMDELRPQPVPQKQAITTETNHRGAWQFLVVIAAFFLGLWLISVWFFDNRSDSQYEVVTDSMSSIPAPKKAMESVPEATLVISASSSISVSASSVSASENAKFGAVVAGANANASLVDNLSQASARSVASSLQAVSTNSSVQSSVSNSKKATLDELSFSFRAESWLEVSDSRGDVLATELQPAGSKLKLVGMAPFDVKLGNAPAVDVQLNGKKVDVIPLLGSNVLIMKIGN
jgi:cytoskeleton protein RodZ